MKFYTQIDFDRKHVFFTKYSTVEPLLRSIFLAKFIYENIKQYAYFPFCAMYESPVYYVKGQLPKNKFIGFQVNSLK